MNDELKFVFGNRYTNVCIKVANMAKKQGYEVVCKINPLDNYYFDVVDTFHPVMEKRSLLEDFLEKYPKAKLTNTDNTPFPCPAQLGYKTKFHADSCNENCIECWNQPLEY